MTLRQVMEAPLLQPCYSPPLHRSLVSMTLCQVMEAPCYSPATARPLTDR